MEWYKFVLLGVVTFGIIFFCGCESKKAAKEANDDNSVDAAFEKLVAAIKEKKEEEISKFIAGNKKSAPAEQKELQQMLETFSKDESRMETDGYAVICGHANIAGKGKKQVALHWQKDGDKWQLVDFTDSWSAKAEYRK